MYCCGLLHLRLAVYACTNTHRHTYMRACMPILHAHLHKYMYTYINKILHTYINTDRQTDIVTCAYACKQTPITYKHACMRAGMNAYIHVHTYIHTYITYIHTYERFHRQYERWDFKTFANMLQVCCHTFRNVDIFPAKVYHIFKKYQCHCTGRYSCSAQPMPNSPGIIKLLKKISITKLHRGIFWIFPWIYNLSPFLFLSFCHFFFISFCQWGAQNQRGIFPKTEKSGLMGFCLATTEYQQSQ